MNDRPRVGSPPGVWAGWAITGLTAAVFAMSAAMKLRGGPQAAEMMAHLGIPGSLLVPISVLELICLAAYLAPPTSALGAILLTGYLGGAICSHLRVGDPFLVQAGLGVLAWLGLYLRDDRLRAVLPLRRSGDRYPRDGRD